MKDMPTYILTNGETAQSNYDKLKTIDTFTWTVPSNGASSLVPGAEWLVINPKKYEVFLAKVTGLLTTGAGSCSNTTKVGSVEIIGDYLNSTFVVSQIIEQLPLSKNFLIPHIGAAKGSKIFNLGQEGKTRIIAVRNAIKDECPTNSKISTYLTREAEDLDDCIAYKENGKWGFLFYKIKKDGTYTFNFEPVDNTGLTPSSEGYRDFVYFVLSTGYPRAIKIGLSDHPSKRLRGLDGANPAALVTLLVLPDGRKEKMYHHKFNEYKIYGKQEWFWDDPVIRQFIKKEEIRYQKIKKLYLSRI